MVLPDNLVLQANPGLAVCHLSCSWSFPDVLVLPDILVLDLLSVFDIQDNVSKGISWIPSNCYGDGDSLNGESLAYIMLKMRQILGLCHSPPQMENQCGFVKKKLCALKNYPAYT